MGLGTCSAIDVVHILRKARQAISHCEVELDADRADKDPKVFTRIRMHYIVAGRQLAAAQVVDSPKYKGKVAVTGLGTPNSLKKYVADGTVQAFELWNPASLGYLAAYAAVNFASKKITNSAGQSFTAGKLGKYNVGAGHSILLGPPFVFTKANIGQFNF